MHENLLEIAIGLAGTCVGFLIKEVFNNNKKELKSLTLLLDKTIDTLTKTTLACEILTVRLDAIDKKLDEVGELRRDVDKMGASLRADRNN